jgi:hypothetical protein
MLSDTKFMLSDTKFMLPNSKFVLSDTKFDSKFMLSDSKFMLSDTKFMLPNSKFVLSDTKFDSKFVLSDSKFMLSNTKFMASDMKFVMCVNTPLPTFSVVALGPVVSGSGLSKDEVVRTEDASEGAGPDRVHGAGLQIQEDGPRHVLATWDQCYDF